MRIALPYFYGSGYFQDKYAVVDKFLIFALKLTNTSLESREANIFHNSSMAGLTLKLLF